MTELRAGKVPVSCELERFLLCYSALRKHMQPTLCSSLQSLLVKWLKAVGLDPAEVLRSGPIPVDGQTEVVTGSVCYFGEIRSTFAAGFDPASGAYYYKARI